MCGIVGFTGKKQAADILLDGLSKLEYRGYDSAGIAVTDDAGQTEVVKAKGRLKVLEEKTDWGRAVKGSCGIGHTRWATHGEPSEDNAHPHISDDMNVVAVHNGIIENYQEIKQKLSKNGYVFYSQTDTEAIVKLIDYYYKKYNGGPIDAIAKAMVRVRGSYALAVMFKDYPGEIYAARKDSPMIIGIENGEAYLASDVPAILNHTRNVYYIDNLEIARLSESGVQFYNIDGDIIEKTSVEIKWDAKSAEKGGYAHFMLKEIHEQPKAVADTINSVVKDGSIDFSEVGLSDEDIKGIGEIIIVACGSSYHVGMVGQYVIEDMAKIPVRVELASEFRYRTNLLRKDALVVLIKLPAHLKHSPVAKTERGRGNKVFDGKADNVFYTLAGPEIAVATTKAYSTQLIVTYLLSVQLAKVRGEINDEEYSSLIKELTTLPEKIQKILDDKERIQWFASKLANQKNIFFIGRGIDYAICLEGSLKLKEISYIHSEAYAAGELKHGTISLIESGTPVVGVLTQNDLFEKTISNMVEVKSRGAYLMGLTTYGHYNLEDTADFTVYVPHTDEHFTPSLAVVPLQLLAYYVSLAKGLDADKPRNLAKSVTVE